MASEWPVGAACAFELAPATLFATFLTSIVGVIAYAVLELVQGGEIAVRYVQIAASDAPTRTPSAQRG